MFIGLWTLADREGRLDDRPKQIKMEIFPADSFDCNALISSLASIGMIERYEVEGKRYLSVVNFTKHQNPHRDEKASTIPAPCPIEDRPEQAPCKHCANTVQAPCEHHANTVQIGLIPDSLILNPDSRILTPESTAAPSPERDAEKPTKRKPQTARGTRLSPDWIPSDTNLAYCRSQRRDLDPARVADNFRDYWTAKPGAGATKLDWDAAWRTWVRNERASPRQTLNDQRKATLDELTGRTRNGIPQQPTEPRDITGESWLIA